MKFIWAVGLLTVGQASAMTGTYTGQFVMTGFLNIQVPLRLRAVLTRSVALVPTLIIAVLFSSGNRLDTLQQRLNVLQSFQLPFALVPVVFVTTRTDVMGLRFVTRRFLKWGACVVVTMLLGLNMATVIKVFAEVDSSAAIKVGLFMVLALNLLAVLYLVIGPRQIGCALDKWGESRARMALGWLAQEDAIEVPPLVLGTSMRKFFECSEPDKTGV
jgi:natural resistance-associated macrophage protein 2